tara:strand:- start:2623 stop:3567 length:945 start_codon:yes stop_codon:yes gene_type:complete
MAIPAIIAIGTSIFGAFSSGKAKRDARRQRQAAETRLMALEANRQDITDPFEGVENPYAQMQVATKSTEIAAEQADISLASSLDTLRATGASAGGATALARAAAQSKRNIGADIEKQEMALQKLRAQGTMQYEKQKAASASATFARQEARDNQQLNRQSSLSDSYAQQETAAKQQMMGNIGAAVGGIATMGVQGDFKKNPTTTPGGEIPTPNLEKINPQSNIATGNVGLTNKSGGMFNYDFNLRPQLQTPGLNTIYKPGLNTIYNPNVKIPNLLDPNSPGFNNVFGLSNVGMPFYGTSSMYHNNPNLNTIYNTN